MTIKNKRAYQDSSKNDGFRILVDRLWPRGVTKEKVKLDLWMKEIAPSNDLRKWFNHEPRKWNEFQIKYNEELKEKKELITQLKDIENEKKIITLFYAAKDEKHNNSLVIRDALKKLE